MKLKYNKKDRFKYRAWDKLNKRMWPVVSPNSILKRCLVGVSPEGQENVVYEMRLEDLIVMQCVGIKDTNKILIYENDIISFGDNYPSIVKYGYYNDEIVGFYLYENKPKKSKIKEHYPRFHSINYLNNDIKVIGNIFQTKDMLNRTIDLI